MGIFMRRMDGLSAAKAEPQTIMIDETYRKPHRTASNLWLRKGSRATNRTDKRLHEHEAACGHRSKRTTTELFHDCGTDQ